MHISDGRIRPIGASGGIADISVPVGDPSMTCPMYGPSLKMGLLSF